MTDQTYSRWEEVHNEMLPLDLVIVLGDYTPRVLSQKYLMMGPL